MALSEKEELELLQLEEEEYQHSLKGASPAVHKEAPESKEFRFPGLIKGAGEFLQSGSQGVVAAAPAIVVFPPPLGPTIAVTGKSKLMVLLSIDLAFSIIILIRYLPKSLFLTLSSK